MNARLYFVFSLWLLLMSAVFVHCAHKRDLMLQLRATLADTQQLVVVTSPNISSITGQLYQFERDVNGNWQQLEPAFATTLGRTGLAWGDGLHAPELTRGYHKREGDGKSPAGIYRFGTAFGYADTLPSTRMPYISITAATQCVEDANSRFYNQIIATSIADQDWTAGDFMRREDDLYKWGIFVEHNVPAQPSHGSCIFFHLWRAPDKHTAGCTGMTEERMLRLIEWMQPEKKPTLVQLTEAQYRHWQALYLLPKLN